MPKPCGAENIEKAGNPLCESRFKPPAAVGPSSVAWCKSSRYQFSRWRSFQHSSNVAVTLGDIR